MSNKWLAIQSFKKNQELLSAINVLSIKTKLDLAGASDEAIDDSANHARQKVVSFVTALENVVTETEQDGMEPVLGADPRLRQLAVRFISAKSNRRRSRSALFHTTLERTRQLLDSDRPEDRQALADSLEDLRVLLEEQAHTDAERVLGDI
ncbi:MAG: hypothetical protein ACRD9R_12040 [Pyrinomonadaceae bacterium]